MTFGTCKLALATLTAQMCADQITTAYLMPLHTQYISTLNEIIKLRKKNWVSYYEYSAAVKLKNGGTIWTITSSTGKIWHRVELK